MDKTSAPPASAPGFVIEVGEEAFGLAVPERQGGLTFHAVHPAALPLHGERFEDTVDAVRAARALWRRAA